MLWLSKANEASVVEFTMTSSYFGAQISPVGLLLVDELWHSFKIVVVLVYVLLEADVS
jgi:hypothetical protein